MLWDNYNLLFDFVGSKLSLVVYLIGQGLDTGLTKRRAVHQEGVVPRRIDRHGWCCFPKHQSMLTKAITDGWFSLRIWY